MDYSVILMDYNVILVDYSVNLRDYSVILVDYSILLMDYSVILLYYRVKKRPIIMDYGIKISVFYYRPRQSTVLGYLKNAFYGSSSWDDNKKNSTCSNDLFSTNPMFLAAESFASILWR